MLRKVAGKMGAYGGVWSEVWTPDTEAALPPRPANVPAHYEQEQDGRWFPPTDMAAASPTRATVDPALKQAAGRGFAQAIIAIGKATKEAQAQQLADGIMASANTGTKRKGTDAATPQATPPTRPTDVDALVAGIMQAGGTARR